MGLLQGFFTSFMQAIKVLTWVSGEPRRAVPHDTIEAIISLLERGSQFFFPKRNLLPN